jgi:hypothetical protein
VQKYTLFVDKVTLFVDKVTDTIMVHYPSLDLLFQFIQCHFDFLPVIVLPFSEHALNSFEGSTTPQDRDS